MNSDPSTQSSSSAPQSPDAPASRWRRVAADVGAGARAAAPPLGRAASRLGDWLARVGWGKFFLLSILLLVGSAMLSSLLVDRGPALVVEHNGEPAIEVKVEVAPDGVKIRRGDVPADAPATPATPAAPAAPGAAPPPAAPPTVSVDEKGVRVQAEDKDGRKVSVQIDGKGIHISSAKDAPTGDGAAVVLPPDAAADPDKMTEAIDAARERIEEIVSEQVAAQVDRRTKLHRRESSDWFMSFVMLLIVTGIIVKVVLGSKQRAEVRAQAASATAAEEGLKRQLAEAQLKMMQAQVEPHFLFNTLASVDYLIETDPARASTMQKNLIQYLRAALPQMREGSSTLGKEMVLCRAYLEILKVRMEDRLRFAVNVPQGLSSARFPPMMLQSLVENAIKHGLEPKPEGGSLTLSADVSHGRLRVTVADTGLGFGAAGTAGGGVGLDNVRERLAALYGGAATLRIEGNAPAGTIVTIEVPYQLDPASASPASA
jgi:signal transduction histidine kinase